MPRKRKGQNLRTVARLQKSFNLYDTALEKKKQISSLTLSSEEAQPTTALETNSSSSPFKKTKCTKKVEVLDLPITPSQSTTPTPTPSTKCSRELKMLNRLEREYPKNIEFGTDDRQANPKISSGNRLLELRSLEDLIQQNTRCKICAGTLLLKEKTLGIATRLELNCRKCKHKVMSNIERTTFKHDNSQETSESFLINCLLVLGLQQIGCGASESGTILTFLNLPHAHGFHRHSFRKIESAMRSKVKEIYEESMKESIEEEVRLTIKGE